MFVEDLETVPETMRDEFVEYELDGKKGFSDKGSVALYNSLKHAKEEKESYRNKYTETQAKLSEFESQQAEKIEQAKKDALDKAKSNGDVEAIEKRYQEQMQDLEQRVRAESKEEAKNEFLQEQAEQNANALADKIGLTIGVDADSGGALADLIRGRIKIDPKTKEKIFHDAKGSALSVDQDGFIESLKKEARFSRLIKAEFSANGGGNANGSGSGSAKTKKFNELAGAELATLRKENPQEYQRLRDEYYN